MKAINLDDAIKITISDLRGTSNLKKGLYEITGCISKFHYAPGRELWYLSCSTCSKKLDMIADGKYQCLKCNKDTDGCLRFILRFEIMDPTGHYDLTIFGSMGDNLLGCTAKSLSDMKNQKNYEDKLA